MNVLQAESHAMSYVDDGLWPLGTNKVDILLVWGKNNTREWKVMSSCLHFTWASRLVLLLGVMELNA